MTVFLKYCHHYCLQICPTVFAVIVINLSFSCIRSTTHVYICFELVQWQQCYIICFVIQFPTITKQCMDKCNRVISQNGRIAFQLAADMFPDTRPAYQFVEILLDATAVGGLLKWFQT